MHAQLMHKIQQRNIEPSESNFLGYHANSMDISQIFVRFVTFLHDLCIASVL